MENLPLFANIQNVMTLPKLKKRTQTFVDLGFCQTSKIWFVNYRKIQNSQTSLQWQLFWDSKFVAITDRWSLFRGSFVL